MKKGLLLGTLLLTQTVVFSQFDVNGSVKFKAVKAKASPSQEKAGVVAACGNDTVRYAENKAYYLQAGFNDPTTGGWSVNKQTVATNIVTTAYKVPTGGSVTVSGAEISGLIMLTNYGAITAATASTHTVYLYTVDATNKPLVKIDSANVIFTQAFGARRGNWIHGAHTLTTDFAIGVKGGATSGATHFLYVAYNQMHISTDLVNPYGEHLSHKFQAAAGGFVDMASNFGNAIYDFEFACNPILTYNFTVDFTPSVTSTCPSSPVTLTNTTTGYEAFTSHSFSLGAFAKRYNVNEGTGAMDLPRDSIFDWRTGAANQFLKNAYTPVSFTTQTLPGTYSDTLYTVALTHNFNYCFQKQIIAYTVQPNVATTFATIPAFCTGTTAPLLNGTSTNTPAIAGTWFPTLVSNTASGTYLFTPATGVCATTYSASVTVNSLTIPTFSIASSMCIGTVAPLLGTTSTNTPAITGSWFPATVNNTTTGTYLFTSNAGQCADNYSHTVNVSSVLVTPSFDPIPSICNGATAPDLALVSNNAITGTWSPSVSNTASGTYTFTPLAGSCASTTTATVTVTPNVTTTFATIPSFCSGSTAPLLNGTSTNTPAIAGSWLPSLISNTTSDSYVFTPTTGICATVYTASVTVTPNVTPTFATIPSFCSGSTAPLLNGTSTNTPAIAGSWSPSTISNTTSDSYVFTPSVGVCATTATVSVTVNQPVTPTFAAIIPFCSGTTAPLLGTTSTNSITGTWTPSIVSNTTSDSYVFTPTLGECASIMTASATVLDCAGIEEKLSSSFAVYPNPSNDVMTITFSSLAENNGVIRFFSADGKLIEVRNYSNSSTQTFDVKSLTSGVYFFQIGNVTERVIVQ